MDTEETCDAMTPELPTVHGDCPEETCSADGLLVQRLRRGDADAGYCFFRDHYPSIYRYLFWLTERPEQAEDLAQETFVRAWRHLDAFDPQGSLRAWLHGIAHREFLRSVRRETPTSLEVVGEIAAPGATAFTEAVALRQIVRGLPSEEREVVLLHYLEGYTSGEIAPIVGIPASTVRRRLAQARERLRQELGEGDLVYLNELFVPMRQWAWLPLDQVHALETRLSRGRPGDRDTPEPERTGEECMERRELLRQAAVGAAWLMLSDAERDVVDSRLTQKVTCAFKGTALADLCEHLRAETGVHLAAGPSVGDEKVTLFCQKLPLREVMRQLSRPFGYAWVRSGPPGRYGYELVQDLRSQLVEQELRNRDRHAALLSLDAEMERFRPYLNLAPDEILARARTAPPAEKKLLERIGGGDARSTLGWGPVQMYFRLSAQEKMALVAGEKFYFSEGPRPGERPLPADVARGILQGWRKQRFLKVGDGYAATEPDDPDGIPLTAVPGARATAGVWLQQGELGQYGIEGHSGYYIEGSSGLDMRGPYAVGRSPRVLQPDNARVNARFAAEPALRPHVSLEPQPSCGRTHGYLSADHGVTSADVLEALHRATGLPIVADYYTRLHKPEEVSARELTIFALLNRLSDVMRLRWNKEGDWLQFRSASYYDDRLKEVPNRLLDRWAAARVEHGFLPLEALVEIAQLPDAQLQGADMAQGARECYGLAEWDLARNHLVLPNLRYLAGFTPEQRQEAMSEAGLPFTKMSLAQQQGFLAQVFPPVLPFSGVSNPVALRSLDDLSEATLRVDYWQPGWYEWRPPGPRYLRWLVPLNPGPEGRIVPRPKVREQTRADALAALRRVDPRIREAVLAAAGSGDPRLLQNPPSDEAQIAPTDLDLATIYLPDTRNKYGCKILSTDDYWMYLFW